MNNSLKALIATIAFTTLSTICIAQYKMDSDGKTLRNDHNSSVGRIDGRTIRDDHNSSVGSVDSDGKTIRNDHNSSVLKVDGNDIRDDHNRTIARMSDVTRDIQGAKPEAAYVALWWFIVKGNK